MLAVDHAGADETEDWDEKRKLRDRRGLIPLQHRAPDAVPDDRRQDCRIEDREPATPPDAERRGPHLRWSRLQRSQCKERHGRHQADPDHKSEHVVTGKTLQKDVCKAPGQGATQHEGKARETAGMGILRGSDRDPERPDAYCDEPVMFQSL